ncbi:MULTISPECIES: hypothetical protein [unclassified Shouchella]
MEVKRTRENLSDKEVGEQLIVDISAYETHPHFKNFGLFCL